MIKIEKLSKQYGQIQALRDVNITFEKGKVYGIIGENGAGKTTLFRCIAGLEKYDGQITSDFKNLKNHLGFLMTEPFFFSKITGIEYLRLLGNARNIKALNIQENNVFDLPLSQYAATYSTGMKKKLALTAILLQGNAFFILDEPFNGVDIESNILIVEIIRTLKALGKTVLIASHIFSTLAETCDEMHLLKKGELINTVVKEGFGKLEHEMRDVTIGNRIEKLNIT